MKGGHRARRGNNTHVNQVSIPRDGIKPGPAEAPASPSPWAPE